MTMISLVGLEINIDGTLKNGTSYYPSGMEWNGSEDIQFAYNGKEKLEMHGFNMYDYGARYYEKKVYIQNLLRLGIIDEAEVSGNFGGTLRPSNAQEPYPGGEMSESKNFEVYVNPVGTTPLERAKNVGHELFSHLYFFFIGKDPRHGSNEILEKQIREREIESEYNYNQK